MLLEDIKPGEVTHKNLLILEGGFYMGLYSGRVSEFFPKAPAKPSDTKIKCKVAGELQDSIPDCRLFKCWQFTPGLKRQFVMRTACDKFVDVQTGKFVEPVGPFTPLNYALR